MLSFDYKRPTTTAEAVNDLQNGGRVVGGSSDILTLIKERIETPKHLVDISEVKELSKINLSGSTLSIGATATITEILDNDTIKKNFPILSQAALSIASPQIRHVGTIGGNLCQRPRCWYFRNTRFNCYRKGGSSCFAVTGRNEYHAILGGAGCFMVYPSDLAPALIALGATAIITGPKGQRKVAMEKFYIGPLKDITREVVVEPGELLTSIEVPVPPSGAKMVYKKVRERQAFDFATVSLAMIMAPGFVRVVLGGVAPIPWRSLDAEKILQGGTITEDRAQQAGEAVTKFARSMENNGYKVDLVQGLIRSTALSLAQQ